MPFPYAALLALGGAMLAFMPGASGIVLEPELSLAFFVGRTVGLTRGAVAPVAHLLTAMPWATAIALAAIVAPPEASGTKDLIDALTRRRHASGGKGVLIGDR